MNQVELNFWNWYIILLSCSPALQKLVPLFYRVTRRQLLNFYLAALGVSTAGFVTGILLFALIGR